MDKQHDTFIDLHLGTPTWFTLLARLLPVALFVQFVTAGLGLFFDAQLIGLHMALGFTLALPPLGLLAGALLVPRLRGFAWWASVLFLLYLVQVALAAGGNPLPMSLHPANGALLLAASLVLLFKVERRRSQLQPASKA